MAIGVRRRATSLRPAVVRVAGTDVHGLLAGLDDLEADKDGAEIVRPLTFHPDDRHRATADAAHGRSAVLAWAGRGCRVELPVAVHVSEPGEPMVLRPNEASRRRQERQASRVHVELPVHLWWTRERLEQLSSVTVNISATGLAVQVPHPASPTGRDFPRPGEELAVAIALPTRTIACTASVVAHSKVAIRSIARLRVERCPRNDVRQLAQFVILTEARRA